MLDCSEIPSEARTNVIYAGFNATANPQIATTWTAQRAWLVRGASDDDEARSAPPLAGSGSDPIPQIGNSHSLNSLLICQQLPVESKQAGFIRIVRAIYQTLDLSADNPLAAPQIITPDWGESSEDFDLDPVLNLAILNAVGDPYESNPQRATFDCSVTIQRNEPMYPLQKSLQFQGRCNLGGYTIPNFGPVSDGQALCIPIRAASGYNPKPLFVPVVYTLRIRADGWRTRDLNAGFSAWYSDPNPLSPGNFKGNILTNDGKMPNRPVPLEPNGTPIDDGYTVTDGALPIIPNPNQLPGILFETPGAGSGGASDLNYLRYNRYPKISFQGLL